MRKFSLGAIAKNLAAKAATMSTRHTAETVIGGHERVMRQTVIALAAGASLSEHDNPGEASIFVLHGRVRLDAGDEAWEARDHDLLDIPPERHSVAAVEDSAILLTTAITR